MKLVNARKLAQVIVLSFSWSGAVAQDVLSLQECVSTALSNNANLEVELNNVAIGDERIKEARAHLLPRLRANGEYRYAFELPYQFMPMSTFDPLAGEGRFREVQFGVPHNINANVQLALPLYAPQLYGGVRIAEAAAEVSGLQYQKAREQVVGEVTTLYYNLQVLHHRLVFLDSNQVSTGKLLKNIELLRDHRMATGTDVGRVELQAAHLANQRKQVENNYDQVLDALKLAMGLPLEHELLLDTSIDMVQGTIHVPVVTVDRQLAEARSKKLRSELGMLGHSRFLPSVNLMGSYGTMGFGYDVPPNEFLKFRTVSMAGLQISWPLFNGTAISGKMDQKRLELQNSEIQMKLLDDQQALRTANAQRQREVAHATVIHTREQVVLAQKIQEQTLLQLAQGTASLTEVLLADNALHTVQQDHLAAIVEYMKADLELRMATGNIMRTNN